MNDEEKNINRYAAAKFFLDLLKRASEPITHNLESTLKLTCVNEQASVNDFKSWIEGNYNSDKKRRELFEQGIHTNDLLRKLYKEWISNLKGEGTTTEDKDNIAFEDIFNTPSDFELCKQILEDNELLVNGKCRMTPGRAGILIGAISAIKATPGMLKAEYSQKELLQYFNNFLGTTYKEGNKRTIGYKEGKDSTERFIKNYRKK